MPFHKRYTKKRYGKRPNYMAMGRQVMTDAQRALTLARTVKSLINVEYKRHTVLQQATAVTDAGTILQVSAIPQNDSSQGRDGGQCKITSFRFAYNITQSASASRTLFRVMIVHDKQTNQAQFALTDLLEDGTVVDAIHSAYNINNASRFNVLYDKVHALSTANEVSVYRTIIKKLNLKIRFDSSAADVTDLSQDSLALVFIGDQVTNDPSIAFNWRLRFIDN